MTRVEIKDHETTRKYERNTTHETENNRGKYFRVADLRLKTVTRILEWKAREC